MARIIIKTVFFIYLFASAIIFTAIGYLNCTISDEFKIKKGDDLTIDSWFNITASYNGARLSQGFSAGTVGDEYEVDLNLFGVFPLSKVSVTVVDELYVNVLGTPFGMKIYTNGVYVTECTEVKTKNGIKKPAYDCGIKAGDYILSVNGQDVTTNEDISALVEASNGEALTFKIMRGETKIYLKVKPQRSVEEGKYKVGIWVKDSTAGIGMLTFYSPATGTLCGLGHGICDDKTGELLSLKTGSVVEAQIISIEKGETGSAGQLKGKFGSISYGEIAMNCHKGIYSKTIKMQGGSMQEVALKQDIKSGSAKILCTVEGDKPKYYDCKVEVRASTYHSDTKNLVVTITDKELLSLTGGIVQGMSGSPIIQNGKLIGAVTHVLVDDPTKGYAIFAENMLETAQGVAEEKFRDAS